EYQPGDTCLVIGHREDFEIFGLDPETDHRNLASAQNGPPEDSQDSQSTEMARPSPAPAAPAVVSLAQPAPQVPPVSTEQRRKSEVAFQSCQQTYDKALKLCGSSSRTPDRDFVLEKLKIVAPSHYAGYLT